MLGDFFFTVFVQPILNLVVALFKLFLSLGLPGAFGFAIIALTAGIRLLLHPFFKKQMHTTKKMQELKPHLDNLSKQHKEDPKKLQQEQMRLYQEAGINPAAGCLFALIQMPVFIGLYNTLNMLLGHGVGTKVIQDINAKLYSPMLKISTIDPMFLGFNLALSPSNANVWYYYLIPVITGLFQYWQAVTTMPAPAAVVEAEKSEKKDKEGEEPKKESTADDFQKAMNTQMKYLLPVMIGYFSYTLPVGLSLYWNIFSIFSIIQHYQMNKKAAVIEAKLEKIEHKKGKK